MQQDNRGNDNVYWYLVVIGILAAIASISLLLNGCNPIKRTTKQYIIKHDKLVRIAPVKELELAIQWHPVTAHERVRIDTFYRDSYITEEPIVIHDSIKGDIIVQKLTKVVYRDIVKVVDSFIIDTKQSDFWRTKFNELTVSDLDNQSKIKLMQSEKTSLVKWSYIGWFIAIILFLLHIVRFYIK